jgi:hypothetical protein
VRTLKYFRTRAAVTNITLGHLYIFYCDQLIGSHSEMVLLYSVRAVNLQTKGGEGLVNNTTVLYGLNVYYNQKIHVSTCIGHLQGSFTSEVRFYTIICAMFGGVLM